MAFLGPSKEQGGLGLKAIQKIQISLELLLEEVGANPTPERIKARCASILASS